MLEEAHEAREDSRRSILAIIGGFALFILVSAGLDTARAGAGDEAAGQQEQRQG